MNESSSTHNATGGLQRANGEQAVQYLQRLQRRLGGLRVLDTQVRSDFEVKLTEVKRDKEQVNLTHFIIFYALFNTFLLCFLLL